MSKIRLKTFTCKCCNKDFSTTSKKTANYCSERCWTKSQSDKRFIGKKHGYDYIECPICNQKTRQLSHKHAKMHGFSSAAELGNHYNVPITCEEKKEKGSGENNPAFGHGGKYSKWSKNFKHGYDSLAHEKFAKEQSRRRKDPEQKHKYINNIEYWIKQCDGDIAKAQAAYTKFQTRDLPFFIEKYGEEKGANRYRQKTERWMQTLDNKTPEEKAQINHKKLWKNGRVSKGENSLLTMLLEHIDNLSGQFYLKKNQSQWYIYDIVYNDKIIEFNGDYWHANPKKYKETDLFRRGRKQVTAKDIWDLDTCKISNAESYGYKVHIVWESDFKNNKEEVIKQCLDFLTE